MFVLHLYAYIIRDYWETDSETLLPILRLVPLVHWLETRSQSFTFD